jgi:hypothetical protein
LKLKKLIAILWMLPAISFAQNRSTIYDYAVNFSKEKADKYHPNWTCLGPSGIPEGGNSGKGIGQIHRIAFDPGYDGKTNTTLYAGSAFAGLWRSEDDGKNWKVVNTDTQLPITSAVGIAINPKDRNEIFICTGYGDGEMGLKYSPNWFGINPHWTAGIYRSKDYGKTWNGINDGFLNDFKTGGTCRQMSINPDNPNQLLVASSEGIYKTENATAGSPKWKNVWSGLPGKKDQEFRAVKFQHGNSKVIFASGKDIYKSKDGGENWKSITGVGTGLELDKLPREFEVTRINLALTPADPNRIYAYIEGVRPPGGNMGQALYIYMFKGGKWQQIHEQEVKSAFGQIAFTWMGLAASPVNADEVYFGYTKVKGTKNVSDLANHPIRDISPYTGSGFHADVHFLGFQPVGEQPKLFAGNHAGISMKDFSIEGHNKGWEFRCNGIQSAGIWSFDDSNFDPELTIIATQDCGTSVHRKDEKGDHWISIAGGDGYSARVDDADPYNIFIGQSKAMFYRYDYSVIRGPMAESGSKPFKPEKPSKRVKLPKTFPMANHPETGELYFGFTEVYRRKKKVADGEDRKDPSRLWEQYSDLARLEKEDWKRQITELAFCESNPNYMYVVTAGQDNSESATWQLPPAIYKTFKGGCSNGMSNCFSDITPNLIKALPTDVAGNITPPAITGIAVHPNDPDKVWVTFTGYDARVKVWKTENAGATWSNADPNGSLYNLPVNNIVYQQGTNDRLYIATDAGVYVKDASMQNWEKYGNCPNARTTELKVNYCLGKLRAATFGRGLWEGDLLPSEGYTTELVIKGNVVWENDRGLSKNIRIQKGARLTVKGKISMPKDAQIIVEQEGTLTVDGGTITNNCNNNWKGVLLKEPTGKKCKKKKEKYQAKLELLNGGKLEQVAK